MPDRYGENDTDAGYPQADPDIAAMTDHRAIDACGLCDDHGQRIGTPWVCDHVDHAGAAERGMAMVRPILEAIAKRNRGRR